MASKKIPRQTGDLGEKEGYPIYLLTAFINSVSLGIVEKINFKKPITV